MFQLIDTSVVSLVPKSLVFRRPPYVLSKASAFHGKFRMLKYHVSVLWTRVHPVMKFALVSKFTFNQPKFPAQYLSCLLKMFKDTFQNQNTWRKEQLGLTSKL